MEKQIILMRAAAGYQDTGGELKVSERDCDSAINILSNQTNIGEGAIQRAARPGLPIVHIDTDKAKLTAERIGKRFNALQIYSPELGEMSTADDLSKYPRDFRGFLASELGSCGLSAWEESGSLLVLANKQLVSTIKGKLSIPHCYPFLFNDLEYWQNLCAARERRELSRT